MNPNANFVPGGGGDGTYYQNQQQYYGQGYDEYGLGYPPQASDPLAVDTGYSGEHVYGAGDADMYGTAVTGAESSTETGYYYPTPLLEPQVSGAPVTAMALDESYDLMYVASATQHWTRQHHHRHRSNKASALVSHRLSDGLLYSSVAGHGQAPASVLNTVYKSFYGISPTTSNTTVVNKSLRIPPHAHQPPFGTSDPALDVASGGFHWGISSLVPASPGYVASVSPDGVRVHTNGGLQVADYNVQGFLCGTPHVGPDATASNSMTPTHITVGGLAATSTSPDDGTSISKHHVQCLDLYQGLRSVASFSLKQSNYQQQATVTCMATNASKNSIVAGASNGTIRLLDGSLREWQSIQSSHAGGVTDVATLDHWVASVGWGSRVNSATQGAAGAGRIYALPDPTVYLYDIRYLSRRGGGIPHPFSGTGGGPRWLQFLPPTVVFPEARLIVASGQACGGIQIMTPMEQMVDNKSFIIPALERGESISSILVREEHMTVGTSRGKIWPYQMEGYTTSMSSSSLSSGAGVFVPDQPSSKSGSNSGPAKVREPLEIPSFVPPLPDISIEASVLLGKNPAIRSGNTERLKALSSLYTLTSDPVVSAIGDPNNSNTTSFGHLASRAVWGQAKLQVAPALLSNSGRIVDFLQTIPTSDLKINLLSDHRPEHVQQRKNKTPLKANPNKLLYNKKLHDAVYVESFNRFKKKAGRSRRRATPDDHATAGDNSGGTKVPARYRLTLRPSSKFAASFNHADFNKTGLLPGWDYPPTMPNAFVAPVLMMLYFYPTVKDTLLNIQFADRSVSIAKEKDLAPEVAFVFHRIEAISRLALATPAEDAPSMHRLGAWAPLNFLSILQGMPEAEQLQILDGSPAAVDILRRPEAFYRFLLYQLDKEISLSPKLLDSLGGVTFSSMNQFLSGDDKPSTSVNRALTVEMKYDRFLRNGGDEVASQHPKFSEVLQHTLSSETRLRAWNQRSQSYETIIQRKIATTLPVVLSLSCACAGRKEDEGLFLWRGGSGTGHWLPEIIEIELEDNGNVNVRELVVDETNGKESWHECKGVSTLPTSVSETLAAQRLDSSVRKRRYKLDSVLSVVRDDLDSGCPEEVDGLMAGEDATFGHNVLHARVHAERKQCLTMRQLDTLQEMCDGDGSKEFESTLMGMNIDSNAMVKRIEFAKERATPEPAAPQEDWLLFNGYVVSKASVEDARAFHVLFKEPSLVVFCEEQPGEGSMASRVATPPSVPPDVIRTQSITNGTKSLYVLNQKPSLLPGKGDLVAFDAEFVSTQEEEYELTETGSKVTTRETRHALARISVIDCRTGDILFDDHVLPRETVVDYLTRFSGIVENDLSKTSSPHHLISTRAAYFKLRLLIERGCVFVGHGLHQDFWTLNLAVPSNQVIDTVFIFHKRAQRYVSLRFLTNFLLERDMQTDVHSSVEDAVAAWDLFKASRELKRTGNFEKCLDELYTHGQKVDWKVGVS